MTIKELPIQEIDSTPDELLADLLSLVRSLKSSPNSQLNIYKQLLERMGASHFCKYIREKVNH